MKQKYKVFINDKVIRFLPTGSEIPPGCEVVDAAVPPETLVGNITSSSNPHTACFIIFSDNPAANYLGFVDAFPIIVAGGGIVRQTSEQGPLLMIYRNGKWDLPKGKIDPGETDEEGALREVREECGIQDLHLLAKAETTVHLYEAKGRWHSKITHWYYMISNDKQQPQPQLAENITDVRWVEVKDVPFLLRNTYSSISELISDKVL